MEMLMQSSWTLTSRDLSYARDTSLTSSSLKLPDKLFAPFICLKKRNPRAQPTNLTSLSLAESLRVATLKSDKIFRTPPKPPHSASYLQSLFIEDDVLV
jgi:hypothetical protein